MQYAAKWGGAVVAVSILATLLCIVVIVVLAIDARDAVAWFALIPIAVIVGAALFTVRGYAVTGDAILVRRLCWNTRLPRAGLQSARIEPDAMRRSIRSFGNGGLFGYTGYFRNKNLGAYRAFVTDTKATVVLRYADRIIVVSPATPQAFVDALGVAPRSANAAG